MVQHAIWAAAAGALIPLMAIMNGHLARATGNPALAAATLFLVGFTASTVLAWLTGARSIGPLLSVKPRYFAGGIIVAFYIFSVTVLAPRFGVGNTILCVMLAQIVTSAAIDHFALMGAPHRPVSWTRLSGLALMIGGLLVTQLASRIEHS